MFSKIILSLLLLLYIGSHIHGVNSTPLHPSGHSFVEFTEASMNKLVNPCNDFYTFACGNWHKNENLLNETRDSSATKVAEFKLNTMILDFLKSSTGDDQNSAEAKAKQFYSSCIAANKQVDMKPMFNYLKTKIPNDTNEIDWIGIDNLFGEFAVKPFVQVVITENHESSENEITIKYQKQDWFTEFVKFMKEVVKEENEQAKSFFEVLPDSIRFHANLTLLSENSIEPETKTLPEFISTHSNDGINWTRLFAVDINETAMHSWKVHNYVKNFDQFDKFLREEDKQVQFSYATIKLFEEYVNLFKNVLYENVETFCIDLTKTHFLPAIMPWIIEKTFAVEWRADVLKVIERVRDAFESRVIHNYWLDEPTKLAAKAKLTAMNSFVGYTDEMNDRLAQDIAHRSLDLSDNFWQNLINVMRKEGGDSSINTSRIPRSAFVHAKYFPERNMFSIPIQYTQMPFYNRNYSDAQKIAAIGFVIGQEMATGFNTENYKLNANGKEENWFTEGSLKNYTKRNECMRSQLSDLVYNGVKFVDRITTADTVANDLGARIAYDAYIKLVEEVSNSSAKPFPDFDFTNKQLFFLQLAQSMCTDTGPCQQEYWFDNCDATYPLRVHGIVRNKPEFSEAYQCPLESNLNPEQKCP